MCARTPILSRFCAWLAAALLIPCGAMADSASQTADEEPSEARLEQRGPAFGYRSHFYNDFDTGSPQSRNIPAGSVVDPGSQLIYLVDTGVNLRANQIGGDADLSGFDSSLLVVDQGDGRVNSFGVGGANTIYDATGTLLPGAVNANFISITNTHPNRAVTVLFQYYNDEGLEQLKFPVMLTCNDTLMFNPFDYDIPGTGGTNTVASFFEDIRNPSALKPIPASAFGSGRFLITATAVGASTDIDDRAEIRFPFEFRKFIGSPDCCNLADDTFFGGNPGVVGDNLHPFNASAVAFNYLIGHWTTARLPASVAFGTNAWARPVVDLTERLPDSLRSESSGDGPPVVEDYCEAADFTIVTGGEAVWDAGGTFRIDLNRLFFRNEVHGGDTGSSFDANGNKLWDSWYGALAWTSLHGTPTTHPSLKQASHFLSFVDDYNGSRVAGTSDTSYGLFPASTAYVLQVYNNDEEIYEGDETEYRMLVRALRVWIGTLTPIASKSVDDLEISDLSAGIDAHLSRRPDANDLSHGWIRFVRANDNVKSWGTWVGDMVRANDQTDGASFLTIAVTAVRYGSFKAGWWLPAAASDPHVSRLADPTP